MHYMPDTEDADSLAEIFWPEEYKRTFREDLSQVIATVLKKESWVRHIYRQGFSEQYSENSFISKINDMLTISAENGADDAFDDIVDAFLVESPLPEVRRLANYLYPQAFPQEIIQKAKKSITSEYSKDDIYNYAYKVGYRETYRTFKKFIDHVSRLVVTGAMNGIDNMLSVIYQSFLNKRPLLQARRHPKRLKVW